MFVLTFSHNADLCPRRGEAVRESAAGGSGPGDAPGSSLLSFFGGSGAAPWGSTMTPARSASGQLLLDPGPGARSRSWCAASTPATLCLDLACGMGPAVSSAEPANFFRASSPAFPACREGALDADPSRLEKNEDPAAWPPACAGRGSARVRTSMPASRGATMMVFIICWVQLAL